MSRILIETYFECLHTSYVSYGASAIIQEFWERDISWRGLQPEPDKHRRRHPGNFTERNLKMDAGVKFDIQRYMQSIKSFDYFRNV